MPNHTLINIMIWALTLSLYLPLSACDQAESLADEAMMDALLKMLNAPIKK